MRAIGIVALIGLKDGPIGVAPGINLSIKRTVRGTVSRRGPVAVASIHISLSSMQIERCAGGEVGGNVPGLAIAALSRIPAPTRAIVGPNVIDGGRHRVPR